MIHLNNSTSNGVTNLWTVWDATQTDPEYAQMLAHLKELEPKYEQILHLLPEKQKNILLAYRSLCEEMSWRMLQLACLS